MEIAVVRGESAQHATPVLAVALFEGEGELRGSVRKIDDALGGQIGRAVTRGDFRGCEDQTLLLFPSEGSVPAERVLLIGLGKREKAGHERLRRAAGTAVKQAIRLNVDRVSLTVDHADEVADRLDATGAVRAIAEGIELGSYAFDELKSREEDEPNPRKLVRAELIVEQDEESARAAEEGVRVGSVLARAENLARTMGNLPGNIATPGYLAERAREVAGRRGMKIDVLGTDRLRAEGMNALLAVAAGSDQEPYLIVMEHRRGSGGKPVVLVGKGLTFDSGGISIKPSQGMEEMKFDMCGGAAVIAAMDAIGELEVPLDVIGIVPTSENLISGKAMKPGDVIRSHLGKTIEVVNTDAEGRLILADALSYASRFSPAAIVDAATLTGSCVIALGHHASGLMGNDESLLEEIRAAGERVGERVWRLPMFDEYREQIRSDYADIKNSGGRPAGTITAAWFLREFVGETPWAHLDIAGTADGEGKLPYQAKGATGVPTRLFVEWALARAG